MNTAGRRRPALIGVPFDGMGRAVGQAGAPQPLRAACGAPGEVMLAGGLTWRQLTEVSMSALQGGGCVGWSLSVYNPDLDPDGSAARRIVEFVSQVAPSASR